MAETATLERLYARKGIESSNLSRSARGNMCDKCLKRAIGCEIISIQLRLDKVFKKLDNDPTLLNDADFIRLANCMHDLLKKWEELQ